MFTSKRSTSGRWMMMAGGLAVALIALPGTAKAGDFFLDVNIGPSRPACETSARTVWIEPVYEDRVVEVEIPAVVRTREVPVYDSLGRLVGYREVTEVVEPARIERRVERVLVRAGYYCPVSERVTHCPTCRERWYDGHRCRTSVCETPRAHVHVDTRPAHRGAYVNLDIHKDRRPMYAPTRPTYAPAHPTYAPSHPHHGRGDGHTVRAGFEITAPRPGFDGHRTSPGLDLTARGTISKARR